MILFFLIIFASKILVSAHERCSNPIRCEGSLLHNVQMARIFKDSKKFVDMKMKNKEEVTLQNFNNLMKKVNDKPSKKDIQNFVDENFTEESELEEWTPDDFTKNPKILSNIQDKEVKQFIRDLINVWPTLGRILKKDVKENINHYSILYVKNGFIIPGGRFREFYYWDSYWIIRGLLLCEMRKTAKGMLDNFIDIVNTYGHLPNGARVYYVHRSQPPLLTLMVYTYFKLTDDLVWLKSIIETLDKELTFWFDNRILNVTKNGKKYSLFHYMSNIDYPRPESYNEDFETANFLKKEEDKKRLWKDLRAAAESGWDFSSRWIVDNKGGNNASLPFIQTQRIVPVDLNAFLCQAFQKLSDFYLRLENPEKANIWSERAKTWQENIKEVFYNEKDGIWYDWDNELNKQRRYFYPSNFAPLWAEAYHPKDAEMLGQNAVNYIKSQKILSYGGGIPSSLIQTNQQWDFPNAWPPLQDIMIMGLYKTGLCRAKKIAKEFAVRWVRANMKSFQKTGHMYEKYHAVTPGKYGAGGEYVVQTGFGWTNGVIFDLVNMFFTQGNRTKRSDKLPL